jgi:hypothetical protein
MALLSTSCHRPVRPITDPFIPTNHRPASSDQSQSDQTPKHLYLKRAIKTVDLYIHSFIPSSTHRTLQAKDSSRRTTPDYYRWSTVVVYNYNPTVPTRLIVRSGLDVPTFTTRHLHVSPRESTQWRKVELWARNVR